MKLQVFRKILFTILYLTSLALCWIWYDWKLFIILMIFTWALNTENSYKKRERIH